MALGLVFITKMLPWALASPFAGLVNDRFNRRRLMIASDLIRALLVLGFLLVGGVRDLPLLYFLNAAQVVVSDAELGPDGSCTFSLILDTQVTVQTNTFPNTMASPVVFPGCCSAECCGIHLSGNRPG